MARSVVCSSGGGTPRLGRRQAIALAGSGMLALGLVNRATAAAPADIQLKVYRKGSPIGTHVIRFSQTGGTLKVASQVDLRVSPLVAHVVQREVRLPDVGQVAREDHLEHSLDVVRPSRSRLDQKRSMYWSISQRCTCSL